MWHVACRSLFEDDGGRGTLPSTPTPTLTARAARGAPEYTPIEQMGGGASKGSGGSGDNGRAKARRYEAPADGGFQDPGKEQKMTSTQLALRERHPDLPFRLIPGIPAVCAAAAAAPSQGLDLPLAFQQEGLLIRPCPESSAPLENLLQVAEENRTVLGLIKVGQRWPWVRTVLQRRNLLEQAVFAQRVGWPDQWIARAAEVSEETKPYFSLLLIRQFWPQVLP